jgi:hypothetical protein
MGSNGDAIIVWNQSDGTSDQVFKSEYRSGSWTHPSLLTDNISPDVQHTFTPQVAMNDNGHGVITWRQHDGTSAQIFKSEFRGGAWKHPSGLPDSPVSINGKTSTVPVVAIDSSGRTVITYLMMDGNNQVFIGEYR